MNANPMPPVPRKRAWYNRRPFSTILRGMILSLPFILVIYVIKLLVQLTANILTPINNLFRGEEIGSHWVINIISLGIIIASFYIIGILIGNKTIAGYFQSLEKNFFSKIPLYTVLRDMVQQFSGLKEWPFNQVVLVDLYDTGILMTGFIVEKVAPEMYTIFVPTAPNPTNGFVYHVPSERLKFINTKPDKAMRTIVGVGVGSSSLFNAQDQNAVEEINKN